MGTCRFLLVGTLLLSLAACGPSDRQKRLESTSRQQGATISQQGDTISRQGQIISNLEQSLVTAQRQIDDLSESLKDLEKETKELRDENKELKKFYDTVEPSLENGSGALGLRGEGDPLNDPDVVESRAGGGLLGVGIENLTAAHANRLRLVGKQGAVVMSVVPNGPAARAGLRIDDVVIRFDGKAIKGSRALVDAIQQRPPGYTTWVYFYRGGKNQQLRVTLGNAVPAPRVSTIGMELGDTTDGPRILGVRAGTDAAKKELTVDDLILEVNQNPVSNVKDVQREIQTAKGAGRSSVLLKVLRGDRKIFVAVRFN